MHCLRYINNNFNSKKSTLYNISYLLNIKISVLYYFYFVKKKTYNSVDFIYFILYIYNLLISLEPATNLLENTRDFIKIIK
ncbi:hypothetical protein BO70DRAFT_303335 [Aspergillus heteromorphus CBS 117.55]|uniref:Uncharacterized protein n=1 Tax=Aspergillus heteromorphus CBS 117.55 TaxID=1448321 RepID=A0A317UQK5_9EURO|nr:uncharacterized protein BO70DRAFT_303335 [Aspergillus heteromorphus CBS 117.55]PWY63855.1 hypothetical protein BO70DRAFT_303335 [Aspergillus heteromorphus CBS 117.55]